MENEEKNLKEKETITITLKTDLSCEMASIYDSEGNGMEGNFWDFHNGCHGINKFGKFYSRWEFIERLKRFHIRKGKEVVIEEKTYKYS